MDILAGLRDKLRFIEWFYSVASHPFPEIKRNIESGEFGPVPVDADGCPYDDEPPFLSEWLDADEALNLVGQAALNLAQSAIREYLDGFIGVNGHEPPPGRGNWFQRYKQFFLITYRIDWDGGPVPASEIEEINLARNDSQHSGQLFGMSKRMSEDHRARFPNGLFAHELDAQVFGGIVGSRPRMYVTERGLGEAIRRIQAFCEFIERGRRV
jgi:hypothetical protein